MNGSYDSKINFRIVLESDAVLDVNREGQPVQLGSSLLGQIRWGFRNLIDVLGAEGTAEKEIFGDSTHRGKILANEMTFHGEPNICTSVAIDQFTGSVKEGSLFQEIIVPAGATIIGSVAISNSLEHRLIPLVRTAILNIEQVGIGKRNKLGFGRCHVEFIDFKELGRVFISYTWEDSTHSEWVLGLANRLTKDGVSVIFDRYDLKVGDNLHVFMEQSVQHANKILLILTPIFKEKAEGRKGGTGYEFSMMASELIASLSDNNKLIPIIRRGSIDASTPLILRPYLACNMTDDNHFEQKYTELYSSILGKASKSRPKCLI